MKNVSETILLFEGIQFPNGTANRNGSPYHDKQPASYGSSRSPFPIGAPAGYHTDNTLASFAFVDGHVGSRRPGTTWRSETNSGVATTNPGLYNNVCLPNLGNYGCGTGKTDLWNPQIPAVKYPLRRLPASL